MIGLAYVIHLQSLGNVGEDFDEFLMINVHAVVGGMHIHARIRFGAARHRAQQLGDEFDQFFIEFRSPDPKILRLHHSV